MGLLDNRTALMVCLAEATIPVYTDESRDIFYPAVVIQGSETNREDYDCNVEWKLSVYVNTNEPSDTIIRMVDQIVEATRTYEGYYKFSVFYSITETHEATVFITSKVKYEYI